MAIKLQLYVPCTFHFQADEDGEQTHPMTLEEANDRMLNQVIEGGDDALRRASAVNLGIKV